MRQVKIVDVVETEAREDYGESVYTEASPFPGFEGDPNIHVTRTTYKTIPLKRKWTFTKEHPIEECKRRLPDYAKGNTILLPNDLYWEFEWRAAYVIKDQPLRELLENQKQDIKELYITTENQSIRLGYLNDIITEAKQHPIKFMLKQIFKTNK